MAFKCTPGQLRDEIEAGESIRDKHLEHVDTLIKRFHGRYWRSDRSPERAMVENHAYEFMSLMLPGVVYDDPRVKVRAINPGLSDQFGTITMGQRARMIEASLNQWSVNDELGATMSDALVDFYFAYCVWKVTMIDHPGYQGYDNAPQKPLLMNIDQRHFVMDASATNFDPMRLGGPRFMGEMWKTDREDLLDNPDYDQAQVLELSSDEDVDKYDAEPRQGESRRKRDEVVCWDIWVPEKDIRMDREYLSSTDNPVDPSDPAYNGTIYTIGTKATDEGIGKKTYYLRPPQPAFCPPWGPYVVAGYMKVPRSPFPLSPLVATAEQAEEVNAHMTAAATDAKRYKKFGVFKKMDQADGETAKNARHGELVGLDETEGIKEVELGGVSETQYKYNQMATDRLNRISGLSDSMRGQADADATATAESIASQGAQTRIEGIKQAFRRGVTRVFKTAAWYAHYGEGFQMSVGDQGLDIAGSPVFMGGVSAERGTEDFDFFEMNLNLEPYSMGHTDQILLQRRMQDAWQKLIESAPMMITAPHIKWGDAIKAFMEVLNIEDADEWINQMALVQMQLMHAEQQMPQQAAGDPLGALPPEEPLAPEGGAAPEPPAMADARSQGALLGDAHNAT